MGWRPGSKLGFTFLLWAPTWGRHTLGNSNFERLSRIICRTKIYPENNSISALKVTWTPRSDTESWRYGKGVPGWSPLKIKAFIQILLQTWSPLIIKALKLFFEDSFDSFKLQRENGGKRFLSRQKRLQSRHLVGFIVGRKGAKITVNLNLSCNLENLFLRRTQSGCYCVHFAWASDQTNYQLVRVSGQIEQRRYICN